MFRFPIAASLLGDAEPAQVLELVTISLGDHLDNVEMSEYQKIDCRLEVAEDDDPHKIAVKMAWPARLGINEMLHGATRVIADELTASLMSSKES